MILTSTNVHFQENDLPVEVDINLGGYVMRVGKAYEGDVTIFVKSLEQLERFADELAMKIHQLKQEA